MLNWFDRRRKEKELEREIQVKQTKKRILRYIDQQRESERRLWGLGKRALQLEDDRQFQQIGRQLLWTQEDIRRWERYLLSFETLEARRDQARMTTEFISSLHELAGSLLSGAGAQQIGQLQKDLELGLERAQSLEERLDVFMDMADGAIARDLAPWEADPNIERLRASMQGEAQADEANRFDAQIEAGLRRLREEMKKG